MTDLGTLGGSTSAPAAVNNRGDVVGYTFITGDNDHHAFLWTAADGMVDLGTLGGRHSAAQAVNDRGQIIGTSDIAGNAAVHAVLW